MKYILALLLTLTASLSDAAVINQEQVFKAVARVHSDTGRGTATAFMEDDNSVFFLTCYHVVQEAAPTVQLQREGFEGPELPTTVVYKSFSSGERRDLAVLQLDKSLLNGYVIPIVPLAREGLTITPRSIYSIGSPEGGRLTMFEGHVVGVSSALEFRPVPKHGRSGSSLTMNIGGEYKIVGLIGWADTENKVGLAMNANQIYKSLRGEAVSFPEAYSLNGFSSNKTVQFCKDGYCPNPNPKGPFGSQKGNKTGDINPNNPWFATPGTVPGPPVVNTNLKELEARLLILETTTTKNTKMMTDLLVTADGVKAQLVELGVTFDSKLENYATRDAFGNYVTQANLATTSKTIINTVGTTVKTVQQDLDTKITEQDSKFGKGLQKVAETTATIAPLLNFIPGWGTVGALGATGVGAGLYQLGSFMRKRKQPQVVTEDQKKTDDGPSDLKKIADLLINQAPQTIQVQPVVQPIIHEQEPFVAPIQTFQSQPSVPQVTDINYTVAPNNQDLLHWRQTMEAVSKKYPETGHAIKLIERAYPIFKSGVKDGR